MVCLSRCSFSPAFQCFLFVQPLSYSVSWPFKFGVVLWVLHWVSYSLSFMEIAGKFLPLPKRLFDRRNSSPEVMKELKAGRPPPRSSSPAVLLSRSPKTSEPTFAMSSVESTESISPPKTPRIFESKRRSSCIPDLDCGIAAHDSDRCRGTLDADCSLKSKKVRTFALLWWFLSLSQ